MPPSSVSRLLPIFALLVLVGSACGSGDATTAPQPAVLPTPDVAGHDGDDEDDDDLTVEDRAVRPASIPDRDAFDEGPAGDEPAAALVPTATDPCGLRGEALQTLIADDSLEEQTAAVEGWLEGVDHVVASPGSSGLLNAFRDSTDALDSMDWEVSAMEPETLASWLAGFLGEMPDGSFVPRAMGEQCALDLHGAEAANAYLDCVVGLSSAFRLIVEIGAERIDTLTDVEEDEMSAEFTLRLVSGEASPLCMSLIVSEVSPESIVKATAAKSPGEALVIAEASLTMIDAIEILGVSVVDRFEPVDTAIG